MKDEVGIYQYMPCPLGAKKNKLGSMILALSLYGGVISSFILTRCAASANAPASL
ncbi:MAG TPA: hypothetical protein V6D11_32070 [Waterburya sp.]|jgi:hypothetical protein